MGNYKEESKNSNLATLQLGIIFNTKKANQEECNLEVVQYEHAELISRNVLQDN